jgi:nucleotide-binding universal stress UspA family protein
MLTKKILYPTDFSAAAEAVLPEATALARDRGATLLILHVQQPIAAYSEAGVNYYGVSQPYKKILKETLREIVPPGNDVPYQHLLVVGDPAREILRIAQKEHAGMIVMGTHGRSGLGRLLMGSVAESVLRQAPCPVVTYRCPQETVVPAGVSPPA